MKSEKISFNFKRDFDRFDALLLIIPLILCLGIVFDKWMSLNYIIFFAKGFVFGYAISLFPIVATNYCYRKDKTRFEKGLFIFYSFCSLLIVVYYFCLSGQPAMDTFVKWTGIILCGISWILTMVFFTIWGHKYGRLTTPDTTIKIPKAPIEWLLMLFLIESVLWVK